MGSDLSWRALAGSFVKALGRRTNPHDGKGYEEKRLSRYPKYHVFSSHKLISALLLSG